MRGTTMDVIVAAALIAVGIVAAAAVYARVNGAGRYRGEADRPLRPVAISATPVAEIATGRSGRSASPRYRPAPFTRAYTAAAATMPTAISAAATMTSMVVPLMQPVGPRATQTSS